MNTNSFTFSHRIPWLERWYQIRMRDKKLLNKTLYEELHESIAIKSDKFCNSHWKAIPAVKDIDIGLSRVNDVYQLVNITKVSPGTQKTEIHKGNNKMNRYMKTQIRQLRKRRNDPSVFFKIMWKLIARSYSFRLSIINSSLKGWYKTLPLWYVIRANDRLNKLIFDRSTNIDFKRVYIPKGENSFRPLGVPTVEWRLYLGMIHNFLAIYLEKDWLNTQHGFISGRGTKTAWINVLEYLPKFSNAYEFDLKNFFGNVSINRMSEIMGGLGIPLEIRNFFHVLNSKPAKLPSDVKLSEVNEGMKKSLEFSNELISRYIKPIKIGNNVFPLMGHEIKGVPQGSNTGPLLSLINMNRWLKMIGQHSVTYADDGLFFSNSEIDLSKLDAPLLGIYINKTKSSKVENDFKFLGLRYYRDTDELDSETRRGQRLKGKDIKEKLIFLCNIHYKDSIRRSWLQILRSPFGGLCMSWLYNGTTDGWFGYYPKHVPKNNGTLVSKLHLRPWNLCTASTYATAHLRRQRCFTLKMR